MPEFLTELIMAFQSDGPFATFLRSTARALVSAEAAPAVNFLLEEGLAASRETAFLSATPGAVSVGWDISSWWAAFGNHYSENIALPVSRVRSVSTFAADNKGNHLAIESHQDVVRLESLTALHRLCPGDFASPQELADQLGNLVASREPGKAATVTADQSDRLAIWVEELNTRRDARPAFATPFGEVESFLSLPDWPRQMRNVLGLAHFCGSVLKPVPVVLCRYNLSRVERAAKKAKVASWAAIPTVLEAGGANGPGAAFFPFPKAAASSNPFGFGITLNLGADGGLDFRAELLHFRVDYGLGDFVMVGEINDTITDGELLAARRRHFELLEQDFVFRSDVP
ncbi:MAG: hypothetical protein HY289_16020 [Planctomycetes bacterium]|nr:hypothetical protein [Planctomycetota bacterium]